MFLYFRGNLDHWVGLETIASASDSNMHAIEHATFVVVVVVVVTV